jgi:hypothetical protein
MTSSSTFSSSSIAQKMELDLMQYATLCESLFRQMFRLFRPHLFRLSEQVEPKLALLWAVHLQCNKSKTISLHEISHFLVANFAL